MEQHSQSGAHRLGPDYAVRFVPQGVQIYPPIEDSLEQPIPGAGRIILSDDELAELIGWWFKRQAQITQEKGTTLVGTIVKLVWDHMITRDIAEESIQVLIRQAGEAALESWVIPDEED